MLKNYIQVALRNLMKNKIFTLINIAGLAISMAVALLILNYVSFEFSYDKMHEKQDRIYRVESLFYEGKTLTDDWATSSFGYASAMKENIPGIEDFTRIAINNTEQMVSFEDHIFRENAVAVTEPSFFKLFSFQLIEGDPKTVLSRPRTVVISELAANKYFKNNNPIGKILKFKTSNQTIECEVSGIIKNLPANSHFNFDFFISWETQPNFIKDFWYLHETYSYVLLEPGTSPKSIEDAFPVMAEKYKTRAALKNKTWAIQLNPLSKIHLTPQKQYEREAKGNAKAINILILIAIAILIIAWINYINLTTSRSMERAREVGIRKVSGAQKQQLISQFLIESTMVNLIALIFALGVFLALIPLFNSFIGKNVGFSLIFMKEFWMTISAFLLIGIVLTGLYPSFILSSVKPAIILKGKFLNSKGAGTVRKSLVVLQFVASLILICGTLIVYAQLRFMQNQKLGLNFEKTLVIKFPAHTENLMEKVLRFKREVKNLPDIKNIAISNAVPGMEVTYFCSNHLYEDPTKQNRLYEMQTVDFDFINTYEINVVEGRGFMESFSNDINTIIINEEAVKQLGISKNKNAIGKKISVEGQNEPFKIIGVTENYHQQSLNKGFTAIMLIMYNRIGWLRPKYVSIKIAGDDVLFASNKIKTLWQNFFPESTFDYYFSEQYYDAQYNLDRKFGTVFGLFALLAIGIACLGLWALALFAGLRRRKEMGIRKSMGATSTNLFYNLLKEFVNLLIISSLLGIPLAYLIMNQWINMYAFQTNMKWWFFVVPILILIGISVLTITYQTFKTARSNPVNALKYE